MSVYSDFFHNSNSKEFVKTVDGLDVVVLLNPKEQEIINITNHYNYSFFEAKVNKTKCCIFYSSNFCKSFLDGYRNNVYHFNKNQTFGSFCHDVLKSKKVKVLRHCHITKHCGSPNTIFTSKFINCKIWDD